MSDDLRPISVPVTLTDADFSEAELNRIKATQPQGFQVLGTKEDVLLGLFPRKIADKLSSIVPDGFVLSELEFVVNIGGQVLGLGVSGECRVMLRPADRKK